MPAAKAVAFPEQLAELLNLRWLVLRSRFHSLTGGRAHVIHRIVGYLDTRLYALLSSPFLPSNIGQFLGLTPATKQQDE